MKALNKKIFLRYPIALAASIVALAGNEKSDYEMYAQRTADYFNSLENDCPALTTGSKMLERPTDHQLQMIMRFAHHHLGIIEEFTFYELENGAKVCQLVSSKGCFRMLLVVENENIHTLNFSREEASLRIAKAA